eukprot:TRINITY_DN1130_c0_g10_i1.p1 TRINITY_DN1130_c0_g10~~TRINITY_DN1130_c0_g10_i1.p1  ORF type:complete len:170 (+),score=16.55 TRINITY_DN1130_c0_g10_i1:73-582(+)
MCIRDRAVPAKSGCLLQVNLNKVMATGRSKGIARQPIGGYMEMGDRHKKRQNSGVLVTEHYSKRMTVYVYNKRPEPRSKSQMQLLYADAQIKPLPHIKSFLSQIFFPDRMITLKKKPPHPKLPTTRSNKEINGLYYETLAYLVLMVSKIVEKRVYRAFVRILNSPSVYC